MESRGGSWSSSSGERREEEEYHGPCSGVRGCRVNRGLSYIVAWADVSDVDALFEVSFAKSWKWCCCMMGGKMAERHFDFKTSVQGWVRKWEIIWNGTSSKKGGENVDAWLNELAMLSQAEST